MQPANNIPVTVTIDDARPGQLFLRLTITLLPGLLLVAALWQLWGLLRSARQGDPFTTANVWHLRQFGWLLLLGWPLVAYLTMALKEALASTLPANETGGLFAPRSAARCSSASPSWSWPRCSPTAYASAKTSRAPSEMPPEPSGDQIAVHLDRLLHSAG